MTKRLLLATLFSAFLVSGFSQFTNDISFEKIKLPEYAQFSESYLIGIFKNKGTDSLSSMDVFWQANGGPIHKYHKDNFKIRSGQTWQFTHSDKVKFDVAQDYEVKVWVANPNGLLDENPENDTLYHTVQVIEKFPERKILIEEVTGAWCGYCPRAPIIVEKYVKPYYPNAVMVAIHTGDAMAINESSSLRNTYVEGVPTGFVSRDVTRGYTNIAISPESWKGRIDDLDLEFNPVDINVYNYYYPDTREWKIDVVADFVINSVGDYRFNIYVVEDGLTGTGSQWNQRNFFNNGASDPYMELQGAGDPLPGYVHNHVVRKMTGGSWGKDDIIPDSVKRGERYVYSETFTIPEKWNPENLHLIGMVQEYNTDKARRPILNIEEAELTNATGTEQLIISNSIKLYPNPVADAAILEIKTTDNEDFSFEVFNSVGQSILKSDKLKVEGEKRYALNTNSWTAGIYFVKTIVGDKIEVLKLIKD